MILCRGGSARKDHCGMRANPSGVSFADLAKVCVHYFGEPRQQGSSHQVYRMPWAGDPRVNIQNEHGKAKPYQVSQVLAAIEKLEGDQT
jgi:hypothetical protein